MAKVNFTFMESDREKPIYKRQEETLKCDLAKPSSYLNILAILFGTLPWIEKAYVEDCVLCVEFSYMSTKTTRVRAAQNILPVLRNLIDEALNSWDPENIPKKNPPYFVEIKKYKSCFSVTKAYIRDSQLQLAFIKPAKDFEVRFGIHKSDEKDVHEGYYVTNDEKQYSPLAVALMQHFIPEAGIRKINTLSYMEIEIENPVEGLADKAVKCYEISKKLNLELNKILENLEKQGAPGAFYEEDNDARDLLAEEIVKGKRIISQKVPADLENEYDTGRRYFDEEGEEMPWHIVTRLLNANLLQPENYPFHKREENGNLIFTLNEKYKKKDLNPRSASVNFQDFRGSCRYRQYREDSGSECSHRNASYNCCATSCPLVNIVYHEEYDSMYHDFEDEMPGDYEDEKFNVIAIHKNTERSYAWQYASGNVTELLNKLYDGYENKFQDIQSIEIKYRYVLNILQNQGFFNILDSDNKYITVRLSDNTKAWLDKRKMSKAA